MNWNEIIGGEAAKVNSRPPRKARIDIVFDVYYMNNLMAGTK